VLSFALRDLSQDVADDRVAISLKLLNGGVELRRATPVWELPFAWLLACVTITPFGCPISRNTRPTAAYQ
jgi:hypothetical protein